MQILNALDLKNGKTAKPDRNKMGTLTQPIQMISAFDKDEEWTAWNLDWLEWQGVRQLSRNARRLLKNYKLAEGIIDKSDYIVEDDNEYVDVIDTLTDEDSTAFDLKFYPIIPNVVDTLTTEFAQRNSNIVYYATDDTSYNELMDQKYSEVENNLLRNAEAKIVEKMISMGADPNDPELQAKLQPEALKTLPEIQNFYNKDYQAICEQWATKQHNVDKERFRMDELETRGFRDMLITDREFWHFRMLEDDYDVELWNPCLTFYHKAPMNDYISEGNWVGKVDMMTIGDVIDIHGWKMNVEQLEALETLYPAKSAGYSVTGYQNDGSFYDPTRSHDWNVGGPSLAFRQYTSELDGGTNSINGDIVNFIINQSEDQQDYGYGYLLRVTTTYWKSQRKLGHLTKIDDAGTLTQTIIDENYKITQKPVYDLTLYKNKTKDTLAYGEHIDWLWINEVWGGIKIGPNRPSWWGMSNPGGVDPIYIGVNGNKPDKLKFQFKGDNNLYGCKLPVEGRVFSDRNTMSRSLVDRMKPYQVAYNMVNNQIADILVDEIGTVLLFDQNALPKHSLGEDWGPNNLAKAYTVMKDFSMLPLDTSLTNTENGLNFQHYQTLNLEQTNRLMSRIQLSNYFKQQAFETIGLAPQRMGQEIEAATAEGVRQARESSYAQTELYFINHCDELMPRVHEMRTNLSQYYYSNKPSVRLQGLVNSEEKMNFEINGTSLMLRDLSIHIATKANYRVIMERLRGLALNNNTTGASIYDLGKVIKAESVSEIESIMKDAEVKTEQKIQEDRAHQQKMQEDMIAAKERDKQLEQQFEASENAKDRQANIVMAEIKAAGYGSMMDINENKQSDYRDAMADIQQQANYQESINVKREGDIMKQREHSDKMSIKRDELDVKKYIADKQLEVAKANKNKYDVKPKKEDKKK